MASSNITGYLLCVPHTVGNEMGVLFIWQCFGDITPIHSLPARENKRLSGAQDPEETSLRQAKDHLSEQSCQTYREHS